MKRCTATMNLCLDIGNTRTKAAIFTPSGKLKHLLTYEGLPNVTQMKEVIAKYDITHAILSSVAADNTSLHEVLQNNTQQFIHFSHQTPLPVTNAYQTQQTLGNDRLAAVIGAYSKYPQHSLLVIDAGTCITYDFLDTSGTYCGGGISPGIRIKCKALHTFTGRLPLIDVTPQEIEAVELVGSNTRNSILSGVILGTIAEIDGIIDRYKQKYEPLLVLLTGGDAIFFENRLKSKIFACPNLVPEGLNKILLYNAGKI